MNDLKLNVAKSFPFSKTNWELFSPEFSVSNDQINNTIFLDIGNNKNSFSYLENGFIRNKLSLNSTNIVFEFGFAGCFNSVYDYLLSNQQNTYLIEKISPSLIWSITFDDFKILNNLISIGNKIGKIDCDEKINRKFKPKHIPKIRLIYLTT